LYGGDERVLRILEVKGWLEIIDWLERGKVRLESGKVRLDGLERVIEGY
jgi:hypothetical protein